MFIVDSQVHVWLPDSPQRPWPRGNHAAPQMAEPLLCERLLALMDEAGVHRAVLIPPSWEGNRTDYALEAAQRYPQRFGVVARVALDQPDGPEVVARWRRQPGMLGIRQVFVQPAAQARLKDGSADWFWAAAESANVPVMVHAPASTQEIAAVARRHPGLTLILDHMGIYQLTTRDAAFAAAVANTVSLARFANVHVKLSGLPHYSALPYPFVDLHEHVRRVVQAYGPRRCFWGTDLSKVLARHSYRACVEHVLGLDFLSTDDKAWIMGRGLAQCLGWPLPEAPGPAP